ncbi:Coenzyme F420 hydrogenase/dehydrogenase, beta subunit C-terminal domain [Rhodococcus sovatensis]|uniref:Coenzyme F420 hydrogenase/dehydrogenase, beta subunit C-terminal domain n=1 Tax=Rhodococcus sovatensis TaxID=1805840 RepID=A0ABZ2PH89_9NOCA
MVSNRVSISLSNDGFMRPVVARSNSHHQTGADEAKTFKSMCPGITMTASKSAVLKNSDIFGGYVSSWVAWANDPEIREAGSSAGVLTAMTDWLISTGRIRSVVASTEAKVDPRRTVPLTITTRDEALTAAGSRYAPVANLTNLKIDDFQTSALIGKPCEASAIKQLGDALGLQDHQRPIVLSFFCAGTPSQLATDSLAELLEAPADDIEHLRYRGNGWPGEFTIKLESGDTRTMSYDQSWGTHLGRTVQWRCKICVDGTGGHSDIAVGDYWEVDSKGYPLFENADGRSVAIARTVRGEELLEAAERDGIITRSPLKLDLVSAVQPLQTERKLTLAARLVGRRVAGKRIPQYKGYNLIRIGRQSGMKALRALAGTFVRTRQS